MEIKVGDYVRTKEGIIGKIEQIGNSLYWLEDGSPFIIREKSNKHSPNIIDLIEVGDYVNGYKIIRKEKEYYNLNLDKIMPLKTPNLVVGNEEGILSVDKILSIVTKEQFSQMEYRLED